MFIHGYCIFTNTVLASMISSLNLVAKTMDILVELFSYLFGFFFALLTSKLAYSAIRIISVFTSRNTLVYCNPSYNSLLQVCLDLLITLSYTI